MAFDGIVIANLVKEFSDALTGGKIAKITQTERRSPFRESATYAPRPPAPAPS